MNFSADPKEAEQQIHAILFYLTVFGYIDGHFDASEKEFIREYIKRIVDHKIAQNQAYQQLPGDALQAIVEQQEAHYNLVFEQIDQEIREFFDEAVALNESLDSYINSRLKLRCYEIFNRFDHENQNALMEVIDDFIEADGVTHPNEVEFRNQLAELLRLEVMLDLDLEDVEIIPAGIELSPERLVKPASENHPFLRDLEFHYSEDNSQRAKQAEEEMAVVDRTLDMLHVLRSEGNGKLTGARSFKEFTAGNPFLDGFIFYEPMNSSRSYDITVLGDLHGCYSCLKGALMQADFFNKIQAFREDPANAPEPKLVLLGDYIDRGRFSYNGILRAVLHLFLKYPRHVYPLRGNHEYYIEHEGTIYGGVLPAEAINSARDFFPKTFFLKYMELFEQLPTVAVFDKLFFVHGGIPKDVVLHSASDLSFLNLPEARFQMLWSDPSEAEMIPKSLQEESARFPFGKRQFANFMGTIGCNVMVRGHTKVVEGIRTVVDDGSNLLLNLFSAGGKYNDDLPPDSSYRSVVPKALTIEYTGGEMKATPWVIDYESFNSPVFNRFFSSPAVL